MIDNYTFGEFVVDGKTYKSNIELIGEKVKPHHYLENHLLELKDFKDIINAKPSIIIIGTGASGTIHPPKEIIEHIEGKGIKLIMEKTEDACKTYNDLLEKGEKVAALLHNTC